MLASLRFPLPVANSAQYEYSIAVLIMQINTELMQPVVKNAKSRDTEPGCHAYYFFVSKDGNEEFLYGIEM